MNHAARHTRLFTLWNVKAWIKLKHTQSELTVSYFAPLVMCVNFNELYFVINQRLVLF